MNGRRPGCEARRERAATAKSQSVEYGDARLADQRLAVFPTVLTRTSAYGEPRNLLK